MTLSPALREAVLAVVYHQEHGLFAAPDIMPREIAATSLRRGPDPDDPFAATHRQIESLRTRGLIDAHDSGGGSYRAFPNSHTVALAELLVRRQDPSCTRYDRPPRRSAEARRRGHKWLDGVMLRGSLESMSAILRRAKKEQQ